MRSPKTTTQTHPKTPPETDIGTDSLDHLDFDPECDFAIALFNRWRLWECHQPARWTAILPCCGIVTLACTEHRNWEGFMGSCSHCHKTLIVKNLRWRPLK